jgi:hypothetical protein
VSSAGEDPGPRDNSSPKKIDKTMSPSPLNRASESTCSDPLFGYQDADNPPRSSCACPSCPQHGGWAKSGENKMEEFMRRSARHMIHAARPLS